MAPPPPPPPPPMCLPFRPTPKRKESAPLSRTNTSTSKSSSHRIRPRSPHRSRTDPPSLERSNSYSPTATLSSDDADKLSFVTDSEDYEGLPVLENSGGREKGLRPLLNRANTTSAKRAAGWGYGWGVGKPKDKEREMERDMMQRERTDSLESSLPLYEEPLPISPASSRPEPLTRNSSKASKSSKSSGQTSRTATSANMMSNSGSGSSRFRPALQLYKEKVNDSTSTLVGSALERKINDVESIKERVNTSERLEDLRKLMAKDTLDYYVIPSEDAHQSEYVASSDKRREWISGFTGTAGQVIVSKTSAYLITDSRYWLQAQEQIDENWFMIRAGDVDGPKDWIEWLVDRVKDSRIGIDARMISHEKATLLNSKLTALSSKLVYPPQNLVDLIWKDKPPRSKDPIFLHPVEFAGASAGSKIVALREWIKNQPASTPSYSKSPPTASQQHVGTLLTSLSSIAYLLNLRGSDIPYNPLFQAYLFVGLDKIILFCDEKKVERGGEVEDYLKGLGVDRREYNDLWGFLRKREWGEGKVLIAPQTSYAISLMLTHFRYTVAPSFIDDMRALKNDTELEGMRRAYLRDGASFVRWLAWLEFKLSQGYDITEYEAASRLTEYRRGNKHYMGLAYENISASGANAALPHYSPTRHTASMIDRDTPYLNDSGGQYRDGTCDTTRTVHFGRPTQEQSEAFTRVLQGHIAIDSAVFPEGTSGQALDVLARKALWKDGLNYMHGTGHGFGSFLNVHEGPHSFSSAVPLTPGHVITNEPGFYNAGHWGMRIESALAVKRVKTKGEFNGDVWLGFERLTCVPIQTRMVKENMLTKEEKQWLKDHNQRCREKLEPYLKDDKRALKWLKRESERGIGIVGAGPGGMTIDWD